MLDPLCDWLREQRLAHGWSVAEMGRQLYLAATATGDHTVPRAAILAGYVRRWEAGKIGLTERYQLHYCAALRLSATQFGPQRLPGPQALVVSADSAAQAADGAWLSTAVSVPAHAGSPGRPVPKTDMVRLNRDTAPQSQQNGYPRRTQLIC